MKRILAVTLMMSIFALPNVALAATKSGSSCPIVGKSMKEGSKVLICSKIAGKNKWRLQTLDEQIASEIKIGTQMTDLPKTLLNTILQARKDKSPWLDQTCSVDFASTDTPLCEAGDLSSDRVIVLYGDSHASMWMSALDTIAKKSGHKIRLFAKLACPIVEVPIWSYQLGKPFTECRQWQEKVYPQIQVLNPEIIIVTDQWKPAVVDNKQSDFDTPFVWAKEFPIALIRLKAITKNIIVIGNNPSLTQDPVACASKPKVNLALCSSGRAQADNAKFNSIEKKAAIDLGATYIDTVAWSCSDSLCPIVINKKLAYFDQWHFSESFVKYLAPALEAKLKLKRNS